MPDTTCFFSCRRRSAESRLSDAEIQIEALESKVASLQQLLESEQAAAVANSRSLEQSWSSRLTESVSAATAEARSAAESKAESAAAALQQQLDEAESARQVCSSWLATCWRGSDQAACLAVHQCSICCIEFISLQGCIVPLVQKRCAKGATRHYNWQS